MFLLTASGTGPADTVRQPVGWGLPDPPCPCPCPWFFIHTCSKSFKTVAGSASAAAKSLFPGTKGTEAPNGHLQGYFIPSAAPFLWATVFVTPKFC